MHIWALTYFEEVGHITECCYFDAMNFFWSDYCSPKWELEVQHSGHMWVQCLPMGTKWQCMPMGMKVQHSGHMSAMRLKFPFSMFQRLNQHRSHGPIFSLFIAVSIENIITDLTELTRGMDMTKREFEARKERDPPLILKDFLNNSEDKLKKLKQDAKTAQVSLKTH